MAIGPESTFTLAPTIVVAGYDGGHGTILTPALPNDCYRGLSWGTWAVLGLTAIVLGTLVMVDPHG